MPTAMVRAPSSRRRWRRKKSAEKYQAAESEIISADHQNKPDIAIAIVRDWIDNKGVDVVAEGVNSSVALAVQSLTRERKKLFLIFRLGLVGPYRQAMLPDQRALDLRHLCFLQCDGESGCRPRRDAVVLSHRRLRFRARRWNVTRPRRWLQSGGKVLGAVRHPFNTADFSSFLLQAQSSGAKISCARQCGRGLPQCGCAG